MATATINTVHVPEANFTKGEIVVGKDDAGTWVILVSDDHHDGDRFGGTLLLSSAFPKRIGEHTYGWRKSDFKFFTGHLSLTN